MVALMQSERTWDMHQHICGMGACFADHTIQHMDVRSPLSIAIKTMAYMYTWSSKTSIHSQYTMYLPLRFLIAQIIIINPRQLISMRQERPASSHSRSSRLCRLLTFDWAILEYQQAGELQTSMHGELQSFKMKVLTARGQGHTLMVGC